VPRYHKMLRESFPNDCIQKLKKAKIRVKVRGEKETVYEYLTHEEMRETSGVMIEMIPRKLRNEYAPEPKPNCLRFPKEFKKKKVSKKSGGVKKKNRGSGTDYGAVEGGNELIVLRGNYDE